jgi:hypothetical protein
MELACYDEHSYQLKLQTYQTIFLNFKYKPPSIVSVEIGTNNRIPVTSFMVQPIIKPVSPLRSGTCLEIIPLHVQTFTIHVLATTIVSQLVEDSERFDKKHDELVNPSYTILDKRLESLESLSISVHVTPHQIGIDQEVNLISSTLHALEVYITPITTFKDTHD